MARYSLSLRERVRVRESGAHQRAVHSTYQRQEHPCKPTNSTAAA
jgi:hypothetical protein